MVKLIIFVLSLVMIREAHPRPEIQVFEIRKTDDRNFGVDDQYFDPDGLREDYDIDRYSDNTNNLAIKLLQLLNLVNKNKEDERGHRHVTANDVGDLTRSVAVVILPLDSKNQPQAATALGKLLRSPLRSQYEDIEDRTAPPRVRRPYDDEDY